MAEACGREVHSSLDGQEAKGKKEAAGALVSFLECPSEVSVGVIK